MNQAFEVTSQDVSDVLRKNGYSNHRAQQESETLFQNIVAPEAFRIQKAALYGDELEQQTEYAHQEIAAVLREAGIL